MEKKIITVSREFGSGGRSIGRGVAERLGYKFYDAEVIDKVVVESGLSREIVEKYDEYATYKNSLLYAIAISNSGNGYSGMSLASQVQIAQANVISKIADEGNCVIIGRGADYILRNREDCFNIFVRADMKFRAERVITKYGETDRKIEDRLKDKDMKRRIFYRSFSMREWGALENYHLMLDSGVIGIDKCVDIVCDIVKSSKSK